MLALPAVVVGRNEGRHEDHCQRNDQPDQTCVAGLGGVRLAAVRIAAVRIIAVRIVAVRIVAVRIVAARIIAVRIVAVRIIPVRIIPIRVFAARIVGVGAVAVIAAAVIAAAVVAAAVVSVELPPPHAVNESIIAAAIAPAKIRFALFFISSSPFLLYSPRWTITRSVKRLRKRLTCSVASLYPPPYMYCQLLLIYKYFFAFLCTFYIFFSFALWLICLVLFN